MGCQGGWCYIHLDKDWHIIDIFLIDDILSMINLIMVMLYIDDPAVIYLFVSLSICLSAFLSVCVFFFLNMYLSIYLSTSFCLCTCILPAFQ